MGTNVHDSLPEDLPQLVADGHEGDVELRRTVACQSLLEHRIQVEVFKGCFDPLVFEVFPNLCDPILLPDCKVHHRLKNSLLFHFRQSALRKQDHLVVPPLDLLLFPIRLHYRISDLTERFVTILFATHLQVVETVPELLSDFHESIDPLGGSLTALKTRREFVVLRGHMRKILTLLFLRRWQFAKVALFCDLLFLS